MSSGSKGAEHCTDFGFREVGSEPAFLVAGCEDNRHPEIGVVNVAHHPVGFRRNYRIGGNELAVLRVAPSVVDTCERQDGFVTHGDVIRDFFLFYLAPLPPHAASRRSLRREQGSVFSLSPRGKRVF